MQSGFWPFAAPYGFKHKGGNQTGLLVRREPVASIVQEALEGFAFGRFQSQAEVKRFLESQPGVTKSKQGYVSHTLVPRLLTNPVYAGYVQLENDDWDISLRKGAHKGLIDFETFERIQAILESANRAPVRADLSEHFPLRGAVSCAHCGHALTACWSTSKTGVKHPYYMCFNKTCDRNRKSIPRARIEGEFVRLLENLTPSPKLMAMSRAMFADAWEQRRSQRHVIRQSYDRELLNVDRQIETLLDRVVEASATVAKAYEKRIDQLGRENVLLTEKRAKSGEPMSTFEAAFELAFKFIANPVEMWNSGRFEHRRLALQLTFAGRLRWSSENRFEPSQPTMPFLLLGGGRRPFEVMAERMGFEPTRPFRGLRP